MHKKDVYDRFSTEALKDVSSYYKVNLKRVLHPDIIKLAMEAEQIMLKHEDTGDVLDGLNIDDIVACALFSATYNSQYDFDGRIEWDGEWLYQLFHLDTGEPYLDEGKREGYTPNFEERN